MSVATAHRRTRRLTPRTPMQSDAGESLTYRDVFEERMRAALRRRLTGLDLHQRLKGLDTISIDTCDVLAEELGADLARQVADDLTEEVS